MAQYLLEFRWSGVKKQSGKMRVVLVPKLASRHLLHVVHRTAIPVTSALFVVKEEQEPASVVHPLRLLALHCTIWTEFQFIFVRSECGHMSLHCNFWLVYITRLTQT